MIPPMGVRGVVGYKGVEAFVQVYSLLPSLHPNLSWKPADLEDVEEDTSTNTTYVGKQTDAGVWLIQKIVETTVGTVITTIIQYATILNNAAVLTYSDAWTNRASLTYSEIKDLI